MTTTRIRPSAEGTILDAKYATLALAQAAAVSQGKTLMISKSWAENIAFTVPVEVVSGGLLTGTVTGLKEARPEWFGDTASSGINEALLAAPVVKLNVGIYETTVEIPIINGRKLIGSGMTWWQDIADIPDGSNETIIRYTGAGGANSTVVRMSIPVVGTEPIVGENNFGVGIAELIVDGNNLAEIGIYSARAGLGSIYRNVVATGTKKHGLWFGEFWSCKVGEIYAIHNYGRGVTIGESSNSVTGLGFWASNIVNAVEWSTIATYQNGRDKTFNDTTSIATQSYGCGIAFFGARSNTFINVVVEENDGAGLYWSPISGPTKVLGIYMESNGVAAVSEGRATVGYGCFIKATTGNVQSRFETIYKGGATNQYIYLTGTMTTQITDGMVFSSVFGGPIIKAEWDNYSIINGAGSTTSVIEGNFPINNTPDSITPTTPVVILYVDDAATGTGSGRDTSNYCTITTALAIAKIVTTVTTINASALSGTPATAPILNGFQLSRNISIVGGTTGRFNFAADGAGVIIKNFTSRLTISGFAVIEFLFVYDSEIELFNNPIIRMNTGTNLGAAISAYNSNVTVSGTSAISLSGSSAATKKGINLYNGSTIYFSGTASTVISGESALSNIVFVDGTGTAVALDTAGWIYATF